MWTSSYTYSRWWLTILFTWHTVNTQDKMNCLFEKDPKRRTNTQKKHYWTTVATWNMRFVCSFFSVLQRVCTYYRKKMQIHLVQKGAYSLNIIIICFLLYTLLNNVPRCVLHNQLNLSSNKKTVAKAIPPLNFRQLAVGSAIWSTAVWWRASEPACGCSVDASSASVFSLNLNNAPFVFYIHTKQKKNSESLDKNHL